MTYRDRVRLEILRQQLLILGGDASGVDGLRTLAQQAQADANIDLAAEIWRTSRTPSPSPGPPRPNRRERRPRPDRPPREEKGRGGGGGGGGGSREGEWGRGGIRAGRAAY
ncbi:hypothetical protein HEP84_58190 [Streptomyces sp. RLB1-33]|nr:hypothetical protein [Streptomyces sp. RLB1-33]